ncbi:MAG: lipopolysaccharide biosynthesis protein [Deltaproteobacteria bacterium]|nr:lipopolysaccharide biosynthesis protein [Deltaproteobacteria bacterium]
MLIFETIKAHCQKIPLPAALSRLMDSHRRTILALTAAAFILSLIVAVASPNIYSAKAMLLPIQEDNLMKSAMLSQLGGLAGLAVGGMAGTSATDLYLSILKSEAIKDPLIERFDLKRVYGEKKLPGTYAAIDRNTAITAGKKDGIITIVVEDTDPKRSAALANGYVDELRKLTVRLNNSSSGRNRSFFEERLGQAKEELARAEDRLKAFQGKNKAVNVPEQARATIESVAQLRAQLAVREVELASLRRQFTDTSPEVQHARSLTGNLRSQIARLEGTGDASSIPSVGSMPALGADYARLMREVKIQENLVELLTKQFEMERLSEAKDIPPFQVLLQARTPDSKSKPHRLFLVVMATLTAFLFSLVLACVMDRFGVRARN